MAEPCEMTNEVLARSRTGPLDIAIEGAPLLCIEAGGTAALMPHRGEARVTNAGAEPIDLLVNGGPDGAMQSFRTTRVWEEAGEVASFDLPPLRAERIEVQRIRLAPGEGFVLSPWSRHLGAIQSVVAGDGNGDGSAGFGEHVFGVEYLVTLAIDSADGPRPVEQVLQATVRARLAVGGQDR